MKFFLTIFAIFILIVSAMGVKDEICNLPPAVDGDGLRACLAYMPSYSYRAGTNECIQFIYGGCGGNANRFSTLQECENKCKE